MWDVGEDSQSPFKGGAGVLEVAYLSLDELELEFVLSTYDSVGDEILTHNAQSGFITHQSFDIGISTYAQC